jgi:hypothetical protein
LARPAGLTPSTSSYPRPSTSRRLASLPRKQWPIYQAPKEGDPDQFMDPRGSRGKFGSGLNSATWTTFQRRELIELFSDKIEEAFAAILARKVVPRTDDRDAGIKNHILYHLFCLITRRFYKVLEDIEPQLNEATGHREPDEVKLALYHHEHAMLKELRESGSIQFAKHSPMLILMNSNRETKAAKTKGAGASPAATAARRTLASATAEGSHGDGGAAGGAAGRSPSAGKGPSPAPPPAPSPRPPPAAVPPPGSTAEASRKRGAGTSIDPVAQRVRFASAPAAAAAGEGAAAAATASPEASASARGPSFHFNQAWKSYRQGGGGMTREDFKTSTAGKAARRKDQAATAASAAASAAAAGAGEDGEDS